MAAFGSFALLIALALAAYNLLAGALALRLICDRAAGAHLAGAAGRYRAPGRNRRVCGHHGGRFRPGLVGFCQRFFNHLHPGALQPRPAGSLQVCRAVERPGGLAAVVGVAAGSLWVCAAADAQDGCKLYAYAGAILAGIQVFFLAVLNFAAPPFALLRGAIPDDGNGLNPLLQYPEMVIHPPMLYLGYVGFSVPFAFALGALMMRYPGEKWIKITRVWTMVTWLFLTCGHLSGHALGLRRAGLGRLLGLGPGGERQLHALAHRNGVSALGDDAGEEGHDEELERVAHLLHFSADDCWARC